MKYSILIYLLLVSSPLLANESSLDYSEPEQISTNGTNQEEDLSPQDLEVVNDLELLELMELLENLNTLISVEKTP